MRTKNVGGRDRFMRAAIAIGLFMLARRANRSNHGMIAELATLAASSFAFNSATGYCMFNRLLGKDTTKGMGQEPMPPSQQAPTVPEERP